MAKPYKLKDGNGGSGNLRDHTGQYSAPGKPAPRPSAPPLQRDQMPDRSPQKTFGEPPATAKPFRAG